jgi:hypothetical protein
MASAFKAIDQLFSILLLIRIILWGFSLFPYFAFTPFIPHVRPPMCSAADYCVLSTTTNWTSF